MLQVFQQQGAADVQAAVTEHPGQADHLQRSVRQLQAVAPCQALKVGLGRRLVDLHLPQLAMPSAVELARLAEGRQLLGRPFDAGAFLANQKQRAAGQTGRQGAEQVVGQLAGFGQEQYRGVEPAVRRAHAELAAPGESGLQGRLVTGVPAPAVGLGQLAEQVIGRQPGQQRGAGKEFGLAQQHFASRVHKRSSKKPRSLADYPARRTGEKGLGVLGHLDDDALARLAAAPGAVRGDDQARDVAGQ